MRHTPKFLGGLSLFIIDNVVNMEESISKEPLQHTVSGACEVSEGKGFLGQLKWQSVNIELLGMSWEKIF